MSYFLKTLRGPCRLSRALRRWKRQTVCAAGMAAMLLTTSMALGTDGSHLFYGRHLIAQYYDCDHEALSNADELAQAMREATLNS